MMIGDSGIDVAAARAVYMPVGIVITGYGCEPIMTLGADFLIDSLFSLPASIAGLRRAG